MPVISAIPESDKITHFWLYFVEAFLLYRAITWPGLPGLSLLRALTIVGALAIWGTLDEIHQNWIPGRAMEGRDLMADVGGAAIGALAASLFSRKRPAKRSEQSLPA